MGKLHAILYPKDIFSRQDALADWLVESRYTRPFAEQKMFKHWRFTATDACNTQEYEFFSKEMNDGRVFIYRRFHHSNRATNFFKRLLSQLEHLVAF